MQQVAMATAFYYRYIHVSTAPLVVDVWITWIYYMVWNTYVGKYNYYI